MLLAMAPLLLMLYVIEHYRLQYCRWQVYRNFVLKSKLNVMQKQLLQTYETYFITEEKYDIIHIFQHVLFSV